MWWHARGHRSSPPLCAPRAPWRSEGPLRGSTPALLPLPAARTRRSPRGFSSGVRGGGRGGAGAVRTPQLCPAGAVSTADTAGKAEWRPLRAGVTFSRARVDAELGGEGREEEGQGAEGARAPRWRRVKVLSGACALPVSPARPCPLRAPSFLGGTGEAASTTATCPAPQRDVDPTGKSRRGHGQAVGPGAEEGLGRAPPRAPPQLQMRVRRPGPPKSR